MFIKTLDSNFIFNCFYSGVRGWRDEILWILWYFHYTSPYIKFILMGRVYMPISQTFNLCNPSPVTRGFGLLTIKIFGIGNYLALLTLTAKKKRTFLTKTAFRGSSIWTLWVLIVNLYSIFFNMIKINIFPFIMLIRNLLNKGPNNSDITYRNMMKRVWFINDKIVSLWFAFRHGEKKTTLSDHPQWALHNVRETLVSY